MSKKDRRAREQEKPKLSAVDVSIKTDRSKSDFTKRQKVIEVTLQVANCPQAIVAGIDFYPTLHIFGSAQTNLGVHTFSTT